MNKAIVAIISLIGILSLSGCGSQEQEWQNLLDNSVKSTEHKLTRLQKNISGGLVSNTRLLTYYADTVRSQKPELREVIDALVRDSHIQGPIFSGLTSRLRDAKIAAQTAPAQGEVMVQDIWSELELVSGAADPALYNMMLTDPINVLADMSDGRLARVAAMSKEASLKANDASSMGAGDQLVGNPNYGAWKTDSSGSSIWQWIGMYALFNSMSNRPIHYGDWASRRNYSYYNDHGRSHYTSPNQRRTQTTVNQTTKSKFQKTGKSFSSPYAKPRVGGSGRVVKPRSMPTSSGFRSSYQKSSGASSARNASSRTFRSSRRGK